jgi:putative addiction module component (TIGR02574 family)
MSKPLERLESEILKLPHGERAHLARVILLSLDSDRYEEAAAVGEAWAEEIERRVVELRSGRIQPIPGEQVLEELEDLTK